MRSRSAMLVGLAALLLPALGDAQEPPAAGAVLSRDVAEGVIEYFNDPGTIRFRGQSGVPAGSSVVGNVAALGGPFTVAGRIEGRLIVLNGNLEFAEGGLVTGDVTVIGGRVLGEAGGAVLGVLDVYPEVLRVVERGGVVAASPLQLRTFALEEGLGRTYFTLRAGTNYNRVEGLPIMFGPVFETADPNSLRVEALGIWRSEAGLDEDQLGWRLLVEQRLGRSRWVQLGATLHSMVTPIEPQGMTDIESSLATFFLHKDFRDYYERTGWSAFASAALPGGLLGGRIEYLDEQHRFAPVASPWTLRNNDNPWRPQPLVGEGRLRTLATELFHDSRNDPSDPTDGWWLRARVARAVGGSLSVREHFPDQAPASALPLPGEEAVVAGPVDARFTAGLLDLRRYARVGPDSDVALRLMLGGSLGGGPLPPQFQHALGGEGSLPGYRVFSQDCGARDRFAVLEGGGEDGLPARVYPRYGCDRSALLQLEYRRRLFFDLNLGWGEGASAFSGLDLSPAWAFFFDLGRGWSLSDSSLDMPWASDLGLAVFLGDLGFYLARPLRGPERDVNFFFRLHRRF